jgi:hypothetical protein
MTGDLGDLGLGPTGVDQLGKAPVLVGGPSEPVELDQPQSLASMVDRQLGAVELTRNLEVICSSRMQFRFRSRSANLVQG